MDNTKVKGKTNEAAGTVRRKTGEVTGNEKMESKGAAQEMKGKGQSVTGTVKEKAKSGADKVKGSLS